MRCAACGTDRPPGSFSNSQKRKPAGVRKCAACAATPTDAAVAGSDAGAADGAPLRPVAAGDGDATGAIRAAGSSAEPGATGPVATPPPVDEAGPAQAAGATADTVHSAPPVKLCAWAGCGKPLPGQCKRCNRCRRAWYCDRACQKKHWKEGGHRKACVEPPCCTICLDGGEDPEPIQCGCGCRGDAGLAHVACRAEAAARKEDGWHEGWTTCPTCGQFYTGAMAVGLARELVSRMRTRRRGDFDRLAAADNLGCALKHAGKFAEAADVLAGVLASAKRVLGKEHPNTLKTTTYLATTYQAQGKLAEAEELQDWVLEASRRVNGEEHTSTLAATANLANTYRQQGRLAEAEALEVKVLEASRRVNGVEHAHTLTAGNNLAATYGHQGKFAEAVALMEEVLATSRRVLGAGHQDTHQTARNLATTYIELGKDTAAAELRALYNC